MVRRSIATWFTFDRLRLSEDLLFQCPVGIKIDLSRFNRLVPQPKRNHSSINPSLEQLHGGCLAQYVWRDPLLYQ